MTSSPFAPVITATTRRSFYSPLWESSERAEGRSASAVHRRARRHIWQPLSEEWAGGAGAAKRGHLPEDDDQEAWGLLQPRGDWAGPYLQEQIQGAAHPSVIQVQASVLDYCFYCEHDELPCLKLKEKVLKTFTCFQTFQTLISLFILRWYLMSHLAASSSRMWSSQMLMRGWYWMSSVGIRCILSAGWLSYLLSRCILFQCCVFWPELFLFLSQRWVAGGLEDLHPPPPPDRSREDTPHLLHIWKVTSSV